MEIGPCARAVSGARQSSRSCITGYPEVGPTDADFSASHTVGLLADSRASLSYRAAWASPRFSPDVMSRPPRYNLTIRHFHFPVPGKGKLLVLDPRSCSGWKRKKSVNGDDRVYISWQDASMDILRTIEGDHNARTESWLTGYSHSL